MNRSEIQEIHHQIPGYRMSPLQALSILAARLSWAYLATIKDLFDVFIVVHQLGLNNSIGLVTSAIKLAKHKEGLVDQLILHSDQGYQYSSDPYCLPTASCGITPSMSRRGNYLVNAPMENFFGHLKEEAIRHHRNLTFQQAQQIIEGYVHFYNDERIQLITRQTPYELRCLSGLQGAVQLSRLF